jgi:hypothetical protein
LLSKRAIVVAIGTMLLAWLMISSIHLVQPRASQGGSSSSLPGSSGNGGSGGSLYNFNPGNASGALFNFPTFKFPFKLPNLFNIWHFNVNLSAAPVQNVSNPGLGQGSGSGGSGGNGGGGGGIGSGGGGQTGSGNSKVTSEAQDPPQVVIPTEILIIAVVIALIIAGVGFVASQRKTIATRLRKSQALEAPTLVQLDKPAEELQAAPFQASELLGEEKVADFGGWGGSGFIKPGISEDLPLIWSLSDPLLVRVPPGGHLAMSGQSIPVESSGEASIQFSVPCNKIEGNDNGTSEEKWIRAVNYEEDVTKLFRLNLLNSSGMDLRSMTAREISKHITKEHPELVKSSSSLMDLTRIFERAYYGKKQIKRKDYERYLRSISGALTSPKVIVCGPRNSDPGSGQ